MVLVLVRGSEQRSHSNTLAKRILSDPSCMDEYSHLSQQKGQKAVSALVDLRLPDIPLKKSIGVNFISLRGKRQSQNFYKKRDCCLQLGRNGCQRAHNWGSHQSKYHRRSTLLLVGCGSRSSPCHQHAPRSAAHINSMGGGGGGGGGTRWERMGEGGA